VELPGVDEQGEPTVIRHWPLETAAQRLHVSAKTLRKYIAEGRWPYQPLGRRKYMTDADLAEALRRERERVVVESQSYGIRGAVVPIDDEPVEPDGDGCDRGVQ
jgi:hypothetical protein